MQLYEEDIFGSMPVSEVPEGRNTLKASLFTLIVLARDVERALHCQKIVEIIARKFPCKIIFVSITDEGGPSELRRQSCCRLIGEGPAAPTCDVLTIHCSTDQVHKVPFIIIPEIIADLPAFLLLGHDPMHLQPLVDQLEPYVGRIVFDISRLDNVGDFATRLLALPHQVKYVDLNWARTKPWRESLARVFNTPERLLHLKHCNRLEIRYSHRITPSQNSIQDSQALFLQAWLASRLHWEPLSFEDTPDHSLIRYRTNQHETSVFLTPSDSGIMEEGNITCVEFSGENEIHYLLTYERDDRHIAVHASSQDRCEMPYTLFVGSFQHGRTLPSEVFQQASSEHYLPMLELLATKPWQRDRGH